MTSLRRATSGFHPHAFRSEQLPDRPTHAVAEGEIVALCGAPLEHVFLRRWGVSGPDINGCEACQRENARRLVAAAHPA